MSFRFKETEKIWNGERTKKLPGDIQRVAQRKLNILHAAQNLNDLKVPPGNQLEALKGNRLGQHSIRVNSQWRIYFIWDGANAANVETLDYH